MGCKGSRVQISALRPAFQSMSEIPGGPMSGPISAEPLLEVPDPGRPSPPYGAKARSLKTFRFDRGILCTYNKCRGVRVRPEERRGEPQAAGVSLDLARELDWNAMQVTLDDASE